MDRFLFAADVKPEQTWELLHWCAAHGVTECSVDTLWLDGESAPRVDQFLNAMRPFARVAAERPRMSAALGDPFHRMTDLWTVTSASIAILQEYFPEGLFMYPTSEFDIGCFEDPTFYRDGAIMLGIVSHEQEGVLSLTEGEHAVVKSLGIQTRDRPEWI